MSQNKTTTIELPAGIEQQIANRVKRTDFESTEEYVVFALEQLLAQIDRESPDEPAPDTETENVEERLESLGYL